MKHILALALLAPTLAHANPATFESITCRQYDYYQLKGDRKVIEVTIRQGGELVYTANVAHVYETLQPDHTFRERDRTSDFDEAALKCVQADGAVDPKVITCARGAGALDYIAIVRNDKTLSSSAFSSKPDRAIKTTTYEADVYGSRINAELTNFDPENCVLN